MRAYNSVDLPDQPACVDIENEHGLEIFRSSEKTMPLEVHFQVIEVSLHCGRELVRLHELKRCQPLICILAEPYK